MNIKSQTFPVKNMTCAVCARSVENMLRFTEGVEDATVNYATASVLVKYDASATNFSEMQKQVQAIGYDLVEKVNDEKQKSDAEADLKALRNQLVVATIFSIPVFLLSMIFTTVAFSRWIMMFLSIPVLLYSGRHFYVSALKKLKHNQYNMDTLIALGTGSAFIYSVLNTIWPVFFSIGGVQSHVYYESAVVIITLILLGNYIEDRAKSSTSKSIEKLMDLQAKTALKMQDGKPIEIAIDTVLKGDLLRVLPGTKFPVDGQINEGETYADESMISGEPEAVKKVAGNDVVGGTINQKNTVIITAQKVGAETVLANIIKMVQEAQGSKAPAQKLADKISSVFVPIVIFIALAAGVIWYFFGPAPQFTHAFVTTVTVLIIACPCALGLATPTAITVGIGKAAQNGILVKDAQTLENVKDIDTLLVDKTGTLTQGKPEVVFSFWREENDALKSAVLSAEEQSEHPVAKNIVTFLAAQNLSSETVQNVEAVAGKGIEFSWKDKSYAVGKPNWKSAIHDAWRAENLQKIEAEGCTIVEVTNHTTSLGLIGLKDEVKPESKAAIEALQKRGIQVFMLTGDNEKTAAQISKQLKLNGYHANLLPDDKLKIVDQFTAKGKKIAMAGDGINDAPALAKAHVGIAMSTGTDVAMESAGITLLNGDIGKIEHAILLSTKIVKTIKQNLFWAFFYNVLAIPVAAGVLFPLNGFLLNPMIAGGAMAFSSLTVVLNSLRLRNFNA